LPLAPGTLLSGGWRVAGAAEDSAQGLRMSTPLPAQPAWKALCLKLGLGPAVRWARRQREEGPTRLANFLFQRIFRINADCPWSVHFTSTVNHARRIEADRSVQRSFALSGGCYIQAYNGIRFHRHALFAPGVKIISANHRPGDLNCWEPADPIEIGEGCWIGANAVILPGVVLGRQVVVGAGSVVSRSFEGPCIVVGVPARVLRTFEIPDAPGDGWEAESSSR